MHWPAGIGDAGAVRNQITHIVDVMPTVLDACGVGVPTELAGVAQSPLDGASMLPSFTDPDAPSPRRVQYFEMLGSRSIISGEWKATTDHVSSGVADEEALLVGSRDFATDRWALFRLEEDFSEAVDVAAEHPEVVAELAALWETEAERNGVAPLKDALLGTGTLLAAAVPAESADDVPPRRQSGVGRPHAEPRASAAASRLASRCLAREPNRRRRTP